MADSNRLRQEHEKLEQLAAASSPFSFEALGDPPDRYTFHFRGKGLAPDISSQGEVKVVEEHRVDLRLPYSFPERPPDIRFLTPIFHPNVSFSGYVNVRDLDLSWEPGLSLDLLAERLWDVARGAFVGSGTAANFSAANWLKKNPEYPLPVDPRAIRDQQGPAPTNIVRYQRRGEGGAGSTLSSAPAASEAESEILFIGEETPTPPAPTAVPRPRRVMPRRPPPSDDDILYIGDE